VRTIEWTPDGEESLNEIIEYYGVRAGAKIAGNIFKGTSKNVPVAVSAHRRKLL
jgi:hypothetical protein